MKIEDRIGNIVYTLLKACQTFLWMDILSFWKAETRLYDLRDDIERNINGGGKLIGKFP
jgi:hypothetical protein